LQQHLRRLHKKIVDVLPVKQSLCASAGVDPRPEILQLIKTRFFVQNAFGFIENGPRLLGRITDGR
jgi:hypothetical protein